VKSISSRISGRHQQHADNGQADAQYAARVRTARAKPSFGLVEIYQDIPAPVEIGCTFFGQRHASRVAVEQPESQTFLEPRNRLADSRSGKAQLTPGLDEAAGVGRLDERAQGGELIHQREGLRKICPLCRSFMPDFPIAAFS
jgi:hypothetical protein